MKQVSYGYRHCSYCYYLSAVIYDSLLLHFQNWYDYQYVCVQVIDFLKKKDFVQHALRHIGTSAITDLVLRLMQCVDSGEIKHGILEVIFHSIHCSFCHFSTSKGGVF